jgi:predicted transcriptional regulator
MVGAFIVGDVISMEPGKLWKEIGKLSGVSKTQFDKYFEGCNEACAIEIQRYWPLVQRVGLHQMRLKVKIEPPQSYRYLCETQTGMLVGNDT